MCDVQKGRAMSLTELELERTYANVPPPIKCVSWEPRRQSHASGRLRMSSIGSSTCTSKSACAQGEVRENEDDTGRGGAAARQWGTGEDSSSGGAAGMRRCSPSEYGCTPACVRTTQQGEVNGKDSSKRRRGGAAVGNREEQQQERWRSNRRRRGGMRAVLLCGVGVRCCCLRVQLNGSYPLDGDSDVILSDIQDPSVPLGQKH